MPSLTPKKFYFQITLTVAVFILLVAFIFSKLIFPTIKKIHQQSQLYTSDYYKIGDLANRHYQIEKTSHLIKNIQKKNILNQVIIDSEEKLVNLVKDIESLTNQLHLQETLYWSGKNNKKDQKYPTLRFQIKVSGDLLNILEFIQRIENLATPIEIQSLSITKPINNHSSNKKTVVDLNNGSVQSTITFTLPGKL